MSRSKDNFTDLRSIAGVALAAAFFVGSAPNAVAQNIDTVRVASGLSAPLYVTTPPNEDRLYVVEQNTARIRIVEDGVTLPAPFLDIGSIASQFGERGLLGLAFHPDYEDNGYFFVNYTNNAGTTVIARYTRQTANQADPASAVIVLTQAQPFSNHNGGCLQFGPDGFLYISSGDGGSANDPQCNSQDLGTLLGKLLRIDIDTIDGPLGTYSIPSSNPFVGVAGARPEIYQLGLRNPWRFSFDRLTGDLYLGDVGQNAREEVNFHAFGTGAGSNLGWRIFEGFTCIGFGNCPPSLPGCGSTGVYTDPVLQYTHTGGACSITGGYVYRGCAIPSLQGQYFYADVCADFIRTTEVIGGVASTPVDRTADLNPGPGQDIGFIVSFGEDRHGELYIVDAGDGEVFKIVPQAGTAPVACDPLIAEFSSLSIVDGGIQSFVLDAGPANAGNLYLLSGSASGTSPGIPIGGLNVPLNLDSYLLALAASPNSPPLEDGFGVLDADGRGEAAFVLPGGILAPSLIGTELNHAFVALSLTGTVTMASNAVSVTLSN